MDILNTASQLLQLTKTQHLQWKHEDGTPCFTAIYNNAKLIICKSTIDGGKKSMLLNQIDDNYEIMGAINRWEEGATNYDKINLLYTTIESSISAAA